MFTISIEANSLSDLKSKFKEVLIELGAHDHDVLVKHVDKSDEDGGRYAKPAAAGKSPKESKQKASAKEKVSAKKEEVDPFQEDGVQETPPLKPIKVSKEVVVAALKEVNSNKGLDAVRNLLLEFGAQRSSEVKESDYAAVVEACKAAL